MKPFCMASQDPDSRDERSETTCTYIHIYTYIYIFISTYIHTTLAHWPCSGRGVETRRAHGGVETRRVVKTRRGVETRRVVKTRRGVETSRVHGGVETRRVVKTRRGVETRRVVKTRRGVETRRVHGRVKTRRVDGRVVRARLACSGRSARETEALGCSLPQPPLATNIYIYIYICTVWSSSKSPRSIRLDV
jgi:hypothetical protein